MAKPDAMKTLRAALILCSLSATSSLAAEPAAPVGKAPAAATAKPETTESVPEVLLRGEPLKGATAVTFEALMKDPSAHDGKTVQLEAGVRKACSKKGCWMELAEGEGAGIRVKFKDYGFFVPLDSEGSRAKVEGEIKVAELSEGTARHYEKEGATIPRGADGKAREIQMVATGVELRRQK